MEYLFIRKRKAFFRERILWLFNQARLVSIFSRRVFLGAKSRVNIKRVLKILYEIVYIMVAVLNTIKFW